MNLLVLLLQVLSERRVISTFVVEPDGISEDTSDDTESETGRDDSLRGHGGGVSKGDFFVEELV